MPSPHSPLRQPNRECPLAAGIVTTGPIHSPWNLICRAVSHSGPPRCLPSTSAPPQSMPRNAASAGLRCLLPGCTVWRYRRRRRRRAQPPVAQRRYTETSWPRARQSPDTIRPATRYPSPTSILTFARPTSPAALSVGGPSRTVLEQCFRPEQADGNPLEVWTLPVSGFV